MTARGYLVGRHTGKRYQPKRERCPQCGKKGLTEWKATPFGWLVRRCRYCHDSQRISPEDLQKELRA